MAWAMLMVSLSSVLGDTVSDLKLPPEHVSRLSGSGGECWGHEPGCERVPTSRCTDPLSQSWAESAEEAAGLFDKQAGFGYLKDRLEEMKEVCLDLKSRTSSLKCTKDLTFCSAKNLRISFKHLGSRVRNDNLKYKMDVFRPGDLTVDCSLDLAWLAEQQEMMSPLQSWAPEFRNLEEEKVGHSECDLVVEEPTYIMKLDATVNIYHHLCDFFNLYLSLHLNHSLVEAAGDRWSSWEVGDKQVLVLDNNLYNSGLSPLWRAFTERPLWNYEAVVGRAVCFKQVVFPLLPRLVLGLFYNTPLVPGCHSSALAQAFSAFTLGRLGVSSAPPLNHKLRLTLLDRGQKGYRRILNIEDIVAALEASGLYTVRVARFSHGFPFTSQLEIVANTDILAGVHGAGLSHALFLPEWAQVVELYNCGDPSCYLDLARLRGVGYHTWPQALDHLVTKVEAGLGGKYEQGPAHLKFKNYRFNVQEVLSIMGRAREQARKNLKLYGAGREKFEL